MSTFLGMPPVGQGHLHGRPFPGEARKALSNDQQRANLRKATGTIRGKRAAVVGELDDWEQLRLAGAAIKDQVLYDLPALLDQFEAAFTAAGGVVHWARDADEAGRIVTGLVQDAGAKHVLKVKSMATQEIELNEVLEAAGITARETDLAELIVQLGHDQPSHILVPAIHRNRAEIREIFKREIPGVDPSLSDRPADLAGAARTYLREQFLDATVAISGANFAIADTGTLCVVESEGNGRMCLTLPKTLISVVGIEKLLPTWQDLEVFLQLLPRSSTGERMNPYTSFWTGVTEGDGPSDVHVVLIDNGRTRVLADEIGRQALRCIRCSACLNVCPVYERVGGHAYGSVYPGPIGAILSPMLTGFGAHADVNTTLPYASTLCGACFEACPVRIDIPEVLVHLRAAAVDAKREKKVPTAEQLAMKALGWVFEKPSRLAAAQKAGWAGSAPLGGKRGRIGALPGPVIGGWTSARDAPVVPKQSFRAWWKKSRRAGPPTTTPSPPPDPELTTGEPS
ncbi:LutB/LldF family L-lactate oxidation iron-sulfur protein [Cryptosporangium minutisporangium]|uniref:LutB/LldF family L-lactate oxidation iron-sulfur protein n=1 Tax=Cryptosporangium minutisporangium TaxID=113569 RepID=A0ABP6SXV2_9ACTN